MKFPEIVVLSSIMLGCVSYGIISKEAPKKIPSDVWNRKIQVIDVNTLELIEVKVGPYERRYETDPQTSYKIMPDGRIVTLPTTCFCCRERVPKMPQKLNMSRKETNDMDRRLNNYLCVRCKGYVYRDREGESHEERDTEDIKLSSYKE